MGVVDDLVAAVEAGGGDDGKKAVVVGFLKAAGPIVETLGPSVFQEAMRGIAGGSADVASVVAQSLDAGQVAALLAGAEGEMAAMAQQHGAELAAWKAAMGELESAALTVLARAVVGMI